MSDCTCKRCQYEKCIRRDNRTIVAIRRTIQYFPFPDNQDAIDGLYRAKKYYLKRVERWKAKITEEEK